MLQGYVAVLFDFQFALGIAFDSFEAKLEQVQVFAFWLPLALLQAFLFQRRDENWDLGVTFGVWSMVSSIDVMNSIQVFRKLCKGLGSFSGRQWLGNFGRHAKANRINGMCKAQSIV